VEGFQRQVAGIEAADVFQLPVELREVTFFIADEFLEDLFDLIDRF